VYLFRGWPCQSIRIEPVRPKWITKRQEIRGVAPRR
jgi:hypothetical protein